MCICTWNLKLCVQLKIAAVHRSAPGLIAQRWSVKQPATQEFANTSCHLCGSLVDFQAAVLLWQEVKPLPCVSGGRGWAAGGRPLFKGRQPRWAPPQSSPPWRDGWNLFLGTHTWLTSSNAALIFVRFQFFPFEIQKASFFSPLLLKNPRSKLLIRHESVISGDPRALGGQPSGQTAGVWETQTGGRTHRKPKRVELKELVRTIKSGFLYLLRQHKPQHGGWTWLIYSAGLLGAWSRLISGMRRSRARVMSQQGFF